MSDDLGDFVSATARFRKDGTADLAVIHYSNAVVAVTPRVGRDSAHGMRIELEPSVGVVGGLIRHACYSPSKELSDAIDSFVTAIEGGSPVEPLADWLQENWTALTGEA